MKISKRVNLSRDLILKLAEKKRRKMPSFHFVTGKLGQILYEGLPYKNSKILLRLISFS